MIVNYMYIPGASIKRILNEEGKVYEQKMH